MALVLLYSVCVCCAYIGRISAVLFATTTVELHAEKSEFILLFPLFLFNCDIRSSVKLVDMAVHTASVGVRLLKVSYY